MAGLKAIRKRLVSVKNTQKITRAMKMVAAAKLRRAQEAITEARPYAVKLYDVMGRLSLRNEAKVHPLLVRRAERKIKLVVLTSNRGLCAGFNSNIIRQAGRVMSEWRKHAEEVSVDFIGRKGRDFFKERLPSGVTMGTYWDNIFNQQISYALAEEVAHKLVQGYLAGEYDAVYFIYNEFKSAISQVVVTEKLLPVPRQESKDSESVIDYIYEPGRQDILDVIIPSYFSTQVFRALLESVASEHGARMNAMDSATKNGEEMGRMLTLTANRLRQAGITKELMEIVSGSEAQNGS